MSESYESPPSEGSGGSSERGDGPPPKSGDLHRPGAEDAVDSPNGAVDTGERTDEPGGMLGEG